MKISAVIPAYNSEKYILDAIDSIKNQTRAVDEIIVIDDGSIDNTQQLIQTKTENIIYKKQENQGPSAARNSGIKMASGDWIAFLDADDQWTPDKIEKQCAVLNKSPKLKLIAGDMQEIGMRNELITQSVLDKHQLLEEFKRNQSLPLKNALAKLVNKNFIPTGTVLASRASLIEAGMFNHEIRFGEDLELWAKIASKHPITCMPKILMLRRLHQQNATSSTAPMLADLIKVKQSISSYADKALKKQHVDAKALIANAMNDLGYWNFVNENYPAAQSIFWQALKKHFNKRSLIYLLASLLPSQIIKAIRKIKNF